MSNSQSGATDNGTASRHVCTRKSAACEQGVCICRPLPSSMSELSILDYLSLAIQAASRLKVKTIPLSVDQAKQLLAEAESFRLGEMSLRPCAAQHAHTPPPLDVTSLTPAERPQRISPRSIHDEIEARRTRMPTVQGVLG